VASEGTGVLRTLSTISKRVIRHLREHGPALTPHVPQPEPAPATPPSVSDLMEDALAAEGTELDASALDLATSEAETLLEGSLPAFADEIVRPPGVRLGPDLTIVSVGEATRTGERSLRLPLVLGDPEGGTSTLVLSIQLDALIEDDPD